MRNGERLLKNRIGMNDFLSFRIIRIFIVNIEITLVTIN
jgi:hypothetical protein